MSPRRLSRLARAIIVVSMLMPGALPAAAQGADDASPGPIAVDATPEPLPVPDTLDRVLEDSEESAAVREEFVRTWIEPLIGSESVVAAAREVPRHAFVPTGYLDLAYADIPLPIGYGQTISQPSLVAYMTELLDLEPGERVLEIGTGSGYQAALLAELGTEVYSIEIVPELAGIARGVLDALGYAEVSVMRADGYFGWEAHAPFDAIIVTAAPDHLPRPLVNQLDPDGGRLVIPIGPVGDVQTLWLVTRDGDDVAMERLLDVRFVPFTRDSDG